MSFSTSPVWTLHRRIIAGIVGVIWLCIAGVFLMGMTNTQPTEISYETNEATVTLRSDKSVAIAFLQCIRFSWEAENIDLLPTAEFGYLPVPLPQIGEKQACSSEEGRAAAAFEADPASPGELKYIYPRTTWINPAALLFIGMASLVIGLLFWHPAWMGPLTPAHTHLIFVP